MVSISHPTNLLCYLSIYDLTIIQQLKTGHLPTSKHFKMYVKSSLYIKQCNYYSSRCPKKYPEQILNVHHILSEYNINFL